MGYIRKRGGRKKENYPARSISGKMKMVLTILLVLFFLAAFFYVIKNREYFKNAWGGRGRISVLAYSKGDSELVSVDPQDGSLTIILIPSELYVSVPGGYGDYKFGSIYDVGQIDNKGKVLVKEAGSEIFGLPIADVVLFLSSNLPAGVDMNNVKKSFAGFGFLKTLLSTNNVSSDGLSFFDSIKFWWTIRGVKANKVKVVDLRNSSSVSDLLLADNSKALRVEIERIDEEIVTKYLSDGLVVSENLKAEVLNSTDIPGLGEEGARYLTNMGVNVLSVANSSDKEPRCKVITTKDKKRSFTVVKLVKNFGCNFEEKETSGVQERVDVIMILGADFGSSVFRN